MKNIYSQKAGAFIFFCFLLLFSFNALAQVGIGTTDPKTTLDVNGAISLRKGPDIFNLVPGNNDDLDLGTEPYSFYRIGGSGADFSITGIIPVADSDGQIVVLLNNTNWEMTISHENNNSSEINRIYVPGEKDLILPGRYTTITFQYNAALNRWVLQNKLNSIETWYTTKNITSGHN